MYTRRLAEVRKIDARGGIATYAEAARRLTKMYPERATAWLELGMAFSQIGQYAEARKAFDRSIRLCAPDGLRHPFLQKGLMYKSQGKLKLAESWFRRCLKLDAKDADAWAFLGSTLACQGRLREAKAAWRRQIRLGTGATDEGHLNLGLILRSEGRYKEALEHANKAIELDSRFKQARLLQKDLLRVLGNGI